MLSPVFTIHAMQWHDYCLIKSIIFFLPPGTTCAVHSNCTGRPVVNRDEIGHEIYGRTAAEHAGIVIYTADVLCRSVVDHN